MKSGIEGLKLNRAGPPFRADHVGSLLRPPVLKDARSKRARGEISAEALRAVEDREIERVVRKQEEIGLQLATDGELRRSWFHFDFFRGLKGTEFYRPQAGVRFHGVEARAESVRVVGKVDYSGHPMVEDFRFLKSKASAVSKMTLPAPGVLHFRQGRIAISKDVYPDIEQFYNDVALTYKKALRDFADAGCRYLQFDDTTWAVLCDRGEREQARQRQDDPDKLPEIYARMINQAIEGRPSDMTVTMHSCRGNFRSQWVAEGGYEPVADLMFNLVDVDGYFLEYDTDRAGGFEPLRYFPKGKKKLVLGLVTSKSGELEMKDDVKRRIDEAAKYVNLDQLCLSPQCGFASTEEGNILTEEEQWAKLRLIVELADEVWSR